VAISFIASSEGAASDGNNVNLAMPAGLQEDDLVVIMGGKGGAAGGAASVSSSGWTKQAAVQLSSVDAFVVYTKIMGPTPDSSATCTGNGVSTAGTAYVALAFRGVDTTDILDVAAATVGPISGTPDSPSVTTISDGCAIITCFGQAVSDTALTAPSGYGDQADINASDSLPITVGAAWKAQASAGAENPGAWTGLSTQTMSAITVALRPLIGNTLAAEAGSLTLSGTAALLRAMRRIPAMAGLFGLSGTAAALRRGFGLGAGTGGIVISGATTALRAARRLVAAAGSWSVNGPVAGFLRRFGLRADSGRVDIGGGSTSFLKEPPWHPPEESANPTWSNQGGAWSVWTKQDETAGTWTQQ
jgi:hypothetical protein